MRSTLTYNDVSSETIDSLVVTQSGVNNRPQRKCEVISVPGRSGDLVIYQDAYENVHRSYEITAGDGTDDSSVNAFYEVAEWLMPEDSEPTVNDYINLTLNGYHKLIDGADPTAIMLAHYEGPFDVENMLTRAGRAVIDFSCRPERFLFSAFDSIVAETSSEATASGAVAKLEDSLVGQTLQNVVVTIPSRNGYGVATRMDVCQTTKNLFMASRANYMKTYKGEGYNYGFIYDNEGKVTIKGEGELSQEIAPEFEYVDIGACPPLPSCSVWWDGTPQGGGENTFYSWIQVRHVDNPMPSYTTASDRGTGIELSVYTDPWPKNEVARWKVALVQGQNNVTFAPRITLPEDRSAPWESAVNNKLVRTSETGPEFPWGGTWNVSTGECREFTDSSRTSVSITYVSELTITTRESDVYIWSALGDISFTYLQASLVINNPTTQTAKPIIKVYGSGSGWLVINGTTVTITGLVDYMYIDSDAKICFREPSQNRNGRVTLSNGFPTLKPGENKVGMSGGITAIEVYPRWWKL